MTNWQPMTALVPNGGQVYVIKNRYNERIYVGSSIDALARLRTHVSQLKGHNHSNWDLQADWSQDGAVAFQWAIILNCRTIQDAKLKEREQIDLHIDHGIHVYNADWQSEARKHPIEEALKRAVRLYGIGHVISSGVQLPFWLQKQS
jgi:hypothetical protein